MKFVSGGIGWLLSVLLFLAMGSVACATPLITTQPMSQYVNAGGSASFSVTATATGAITYQWQFNGGNIAGANSAALTITNVQAYQGGSYSVVVTADGSSVSSVNALLTVLIAPTFTTNLTNTTVVRTHSLYLSVYLSGSSPFTFQWKKDGVAIPGATSSYYSITATTSSAGSYTVTVTNPAGSQTSNAAVVTVVEPIAISSSPTSQTVDKGATTTLTVAATGPGTLTYQWYKDYNPITGATSASYTISNPTSSNTGSYYVQVGNEYQYAVPSNSATVTVRDVPIILAQPSTTISGIEGNYYSMSVSANGAAPLSYQWKKDGVALVAGASSSFSNVTSYYLDFYPLSASQAGTYTVDVTNAYGTVTSTGSVVTVATNTSFPSITAQPASLSVTAGNPAMFSVTATGPSYSTITYQWKKNGTTIPGATAANLTMLAVTSSDAGTYTVVVTNGYGSVTSANATLTVGPAPTAPVITQGPTSQTIVVGQSATMFVQATGTPSPAYQWKKDGVILTGQITDTLVIPSALLSDAGSYTVLVSNSAGTVTSDPAVLTVGVSTRVINLSSRTQVSTDANILISGFIIDGTAPKKILIRAVGPTLAKFGVDGVLANPFLKLIAADGSTVASNDDWAVTTNLSEVSAAHAKTGAFPLAADSKDAALLVTLAPGAYTAQVSGVGGTTGIALVEVWEVDTDTPNHLVNISTRAFVGTGSQVLIGGLIVSGSTSKKFLLRAVGPGLAPFNVPGVLADPSLDLVGADGKTVATNDNWGSASNVSDIRTASQGLFTLAENSKDAVLLVTLPPGGYTAIVRGVGNTTGVALLEIYDVP